MLDYVSCKGARCAIDLLFDKIVQMDNNGDTEIVYLIIRQ